MFSDSVLDVKYPYLSNEQGELPVLLLKVFLFTCSVLCFVWGDVIFTLDHLSKHRRTAAIPVILHMCSRVSCPPLSHVFTFAFVSLSSTALPLCGISCGLAHPSTLFCFLYYPSYSPRSPVLPRSALLCNFQILLLLLVLSVLLLFLPCININSSDSLQFLVPFC